MWTYRCINNGREIDNVEADTYGTETEARNAGELHLDDFCPPHSPNRHLYRVEVVAARKDIRP